MDRDETVAVVNRPAAYAELLVDSLDRYAQGFPAFGGVKTSSDWKTNFQQIVLNGYFTRLGVTQIQFSWNLPTIIADYNDKFTFTAGGVSPAPGTFTATIPQGYYTPTALAAAIQAAMLVVNAGNLWVVAFDDLYGSFNIIGNGVPAVTFYINQPANLVETRCLTTLGFLNASASSLGAGQLAVNGSPPTMLATRFIDICSSYLTKFQRVKDSTTLQNPTISNVIARIYPTAPNTAVQTIGAWTTAVTELPSNSQGSHPFSICIDYNNPKWIKWSPDEPLSNFDLQLRDDFGQLVPYNLGANGIGFGATCEYQLTILASES